MVSQPQPNFLPRNVFHGSDWLTSSKPAVSACWEVRTSIESSSSLAVTIRWVLPKSITISSKRPLLDFWDTEISERLEMELKMDNRGNKAPAFSEFTLVFWHTGPGCILVFFVTATTRM